MGQKLICLILIRVFSNTTIYGDEIYLGWVHLKNLETHFANRLLEDRAKNGEYVDLPDFIERLNPGVEQIRILIKAGAFRFTGRTKKELMWDHLMLIKGKPQPQSKPLFVEKRKAFELPKLRTNIIEDAYDEMDLFGFPVSISRFDLLKTIYRGDTNAKELLSKLGKVVRIVGELVAIKYVHTVKKEWMHFGCFLDVNGCFFDTIHFPNSLKSYPFTGYGVYLIQGVVVEEFGFPGIEVQKLGRLAYQSDPRTE